MEKFHTGGWYLKRKYVRMIPLNQINGGGIFTH